MSYYHAQTKEEARRLMQTYAVFTRQLSLEFVPDVASWWETYGENTCYQLSSKHALILIHNKNLLKNKNIYSWNEYPQEE